MSGKAQQDQKDHKRWSPEQHFFTPTDSHNNSWPADQWDEPAESSLMKDLPNAGYSALSAEPVNGKGTRPERKRKYDTKGTVVETKGAGKQETTAATPFTIVSEEMPSWKGWTGRYSTRFLTFSAVAIEVFFFWFTYLGAVKGFNRAGAGKNAETKATAGTMAGGNWGSDVASVNAVEEAELMISTPQKKEKAEREKFVNFLEAMEVEVLDAKINSRKTLTPEKIAEGVAVAAINAKKKNKEPLSQEEIQKSRAWDLGEQPLTPEEIAEGAKVAALDAKKERKEPLTPAEIKKSEAWHLERQKEIEKSEAWHLQKKIADRTWWNTWVAALPNNMLLTSSDLVGVADLIGTDSPYAFVPLSIWIMFAGPTYYYMLSQSSIEAYSKKSFLPPAKMTSSDLAKFEKKLQILGNDIYRATLGVITLAELPGSFQTIWPAISLPSQRAMMVPYIAAFILGFYVADMQRSPKVEKRFEKEIFEYIQPEDREEAAATLALSDYASDIFFTAIRTGTVAYLANSAASTLDPMYSALIALTMGAVMGKLSWEGRKDLLIREAASKLPAVQERKKVEDDKKPKGKDKKTSAEKYFDEVYAHLEGNTGIRYTAIFLNLLGRSVRVLSFIGFLSNVQTLMFGEGDEPLTFGQVIALSLLCGTAVAEADGPNFYNDITDFLTYLYAKIIITKSVSDVPGKGGFVNLVKRFYHYYYTPKSRLDLQEVLIARIKQLQADEIKQKAAANKAVEAFYEEAIGKIRMDRAIARLDGQPVPDDEEMTLAEFTAQVREMADNPKYQVPSRYSPTAPYAKLYAAIEAVKKHMATEKKLADTRAVANDVKQQLPSKPQPSQSAGPDRWTQMKTWFSSWRSKKPSSQQDAQNDGAGDIPFAPLAEEDPGDGYRDGDIETKASAHDNERKEGHPPAAGNNRAPDFNIFAEDERMTSGNHPPRSNDMADEGKQSAPSRSSSSWWPFGGRSAGPTDRTPSQPIANDMADEGKQSAPSRSSSSWWPFGGSSTGTGPTEKTPLVPNTNDVNSRQGRSQSGAVDQGHPQPPLSEADVDHDGIDIYGGDGRPRDRSVDI